VFEFYASGPSDPRARRPVDWLRAVAFLLLLLLAAVLAEIGADLDRGLSEVLTSFPGFLRALWLTGFWGAVGWALTLVVVALFRHRLPLALEGLGAIVVALGLCLVVAEIVSGEPGELISRVADSNGPPVFPPAVLAMTSSVIAVMAPYLALPFRRVGRALVLAQLLGALFLGVSQSFGAIAALAIGLLAGTAMHLVRGSPGGFPTVTRVKAALADLGAEVDELAPSEMAKKAWPRSWALMGAVLSRCGCMGGTRGRASCCRVCGGVPGTGAAVAAPASAAASTSSTRGS
jgi:hypothetical protein